MIIKKDDFGFDLNFTILHADGSVYDLTGFVVHLKTWEGEGTLVLDEECMIVNAVQGKCKYTIQLGDFAIVKKYFAEIELTKSGWREDTDTFEINVILSV